MDILQGLIACCKRPWDIRISGFDVHGTFAGWPPWLRLKLQRMSVVHPEDMCGCPQDIQMSTNCCPLDIRWTFMAHWAVHHSPAVCCLNLRTTQQSLCGLLWSMQRNRGTGQQAVTSTSSKRLFAHGDSPQTSSRPRRVLKRLTWQEGTIAKTRRTPEHVDLGAACPR